MLQTRQYRAQLSKIMNNWNVNHYLKSCTCFTTNVFLEIVWFESFYDSMCVCMLLFFCMCQKSFLFFIYFLSDGMNARMFYLVH